MGKGYYYQYVLPCEKEVDPYTHPISAPTHPPSLGTTNRNIKAHVANFPFVQQSPYGISPRAAESSFPTMLFFREVGTHSLFGGPSAPSPPVGGGWAS